MSRRSSRSCQTLGRLARQPARARRPLRPTSDRRARVAPTVRRSPGEDGPDSKHVASPAWSLAAGWTEPVASSQSLGQLQLDHAWLQEEHTTLQQERNDLVAERDRLREERDGLLGERDASAESKLDKLYAALQYTLGLVYTVLMSDVTMCKLILAKLTPQAEAASVVVLGVVWACLATLRVWFLLQLARSIVESIGTPCSACRVAGLCSTTR